MTRITKYSAEEFFRYHEFRRSDGQGWLNESETLTGTPTVTVTEKVAGTDVSSGMVSAVAVYDNTKVRYILKGGTTRVSYYVTVTAQTSNGQTFEDRLELQVL